MESDIISGIRLVILTVMVILFVVTTAHYYLAEGAEKGTAGFWLLILLANLWLVAMAAKTGSII